MLLATTFIFMFNFLTLYNKCLPFTLLFQEGKTALMWASAEDHTVVVQRLLSVGAQTDQQDEVRYT